MGTRCHAACVDRFYSRGKLSLSGMSLHLERILTHLQVVLLGSAKHFITPHGALGLLAFIVTFIAGFFELHLIPTSLRFYITARGIILGFLITLSVALFVTGFVDIQRISLCTVQLPDAAFVIITMLSMTSLIGGITVAQARWVMEWWLSKKASAQDDMSDVAIVKEERVRRNIVNIGAREYAASIYSTFVTR